MMGTKINGIERSPFVPKPPPHPIHQRVELRFPIVPAGDAGLIANDHELEAGPPKQATSLEDSIDELHILDAVKIIYLTIDDTVPIEKHCSVHSASCFFLQPRSANVETCPTYL